MRMHVLSLPKNESGAGLFGMCDYTHVRFHARTESKKGGGMYVRGGCYQWVCVYKKFCCREVTICKH
jgi:hypothetical protein